MIICDFENPWAVMVNLLEVKHITLAEVTKEQWQADGFFSQADMLRGMKEFYPNITLDSPVSVLFWDDVKGFWATDEGKETFRSLNDLIY